MSEDDRIALARAWVDALNRDDHEALIAATHEDVELVPLVADLEGVSHRGHDGLRCWIAQRSGVWADSRVELRELRALGDCVVAHTTVRGTARGEGPVVEQQVVGVLGFRGDRIAWMGFFRSEEEAVAAASRGASSGWTSRS